MYYSNTYHVESMKSTRSMKIDATGDTVRSTLFESVLPYCVIEYHLLENTPLHPPTNPTTSPVINYRPPLMYLDCTISIPANPIPTRWSGSSKWWTRRFCSANPKPSWWTADIMCWRRTSVRNLIPRCTSTHPAEQRDSPLLSQ